MPVGTSLGDQFENMLHMMTSKFQPQDAENNVISPKQDMMKDPGIEVSPDTLEDRKTFAPFTMQVSDKAFLNAPKSPDVEDRRTNDVPDLTIQRLIDPKPFYHSIEGTQHLPPQAYNPYELPLFKQTQPGSMTDELGGSDIDRIALRQSKLPHTAEEIKTMHQPIKPLKTQAEDNPEDKIVAQDKTGRIKFTEGDIDRAINIGMAFSGGGLGVTNSRSVGGLFKFLRPDSEKLATPVDALLLKKHMQAYGHKAEVESLPTLKENRVWIQHPSDPDQFAYVRPNNAADPRAPLDWEPK